MSAEELTPIEKRAVKLTIKFIRAKLGLISEAAKIALNEERCDEFLYTQIEQLHTATESTERMFGQGLCAELLQYEIHSTGKRPQI